MGISNASLTCIGEMAKLMRLDLTAAPVSDFGIAKLTELPSLQRLTVKECSKVTQAGLLWMLQNSRSPSMKACATSITSSR